MKKENRDLVDKILTELGDDFCVTIGIRTNNPDENYFITPTYNIKRKGLFESSHWLFGAKTVLQLCGREYDPITSCDDFDPNVDPVDGLNERWEIGSGRGEPTELSHYVVNRKPIPEPIKKILQERGLPEWSRYSG